MRVVMTIWLLLFSCIAQGQSFSSSTSGNVDIYSVLNLNITNLSGVVSFNTPNDYFSGQTINNSATIAIKSNVSWQVSVSAQSAFFQPMTTGASTNMPASVVGIRRNGTSSFNSLSTGGATLKTGSRGNASTSGNSFDIDMSLSPGFEYNGGIYNIGILYTLTQQ